MKELLKQMLIGLIKTKSPKAAMAYERYEEYAVPLIRAHRYYGHNRKAGMSVQEALMKAANDAKVPVHFLTDYLKDKTGDLGTFAVSQVLGETKFADPNKTSFKTNF